MALYSNHLRYGTDPKKILNKAEKVIRCAALNGGRVFGGYVRDVVVPIMQGVSAENVEFNDLDIWFCSRADASNFLTLLPSVTGLTPLEHEEQEGCLIPAKRYILFEHPAGHVLFLDIIVSRHFPTCDLSVNLLSWDGEKLLANKPFDALMAAMPRGWDEELALPAVKYNVKELFEQILEHRSDIISPFKQLSESNQIPWAPMARRRLEDFSVRRLWKLDATDRSRISYRLYSLYPAVGEENGGDSREFSTVSRRVTKVELDLSCDHRSDNERERKSENVTCPHCHCRFTLRGTVSADVAPDTEENYNVPV